MISDFSSIMASAFAVLVAFVISYLLMPAVRKLAIRLGAVDMPGKKGTDSERHLHKKPTPRMGGLSICIGTIVAVVLFVPLSQRTLSMLLGSVIIMVLGMVDDVKNLPAKVKLVFQILAACIAVQGGNLIRFFSSLSAVEGGAHTNLGILAAPVTVLWIVLITNAVNLIDGLDGLAAGVSTIAAITMVIVALIYSNYVVAVTIAALAGACIGFLPYNRPPASIFMGDTGSTFIGYILAVASIQGLFKFYALISFAIPFVMLGLPIFDVCYAVILRVSHGESPFHADRKHVHYRLIDMGFNTKETVAVLYAASAILGLTAVICTTSGLIRALIAFVFMALLGVFGARLYLHHLRLIHAQQEEKQEAEMRRLRKAAKAAQLNAAKADDPASDADQSTPTAP